MDWDSQNLLLTTDNGFAAGATYSSAYLYDSQTSNPDYKGMTVFYGAQADVRQEPMYDSKGVPTTPKPLPALLQGTRMAMAADTGIAANTLTLNGIALGELAAPDDGSTLQAGDIATWINDQTGSVGTPFDNAISDIAFSPTPSVKDFGAFSIYVDGKLRTVTPAPSAANLDALAVNLQSQLRALDVRDGIANATTDLTVTVEGTTLSVTSASSRGISSLALTKSVTASASNEIRVTDDQLKLTLPLAINGFIIPPEDGGYDSKAALMDAINGETWLTGVTANLAADGAMVLRTANGENIKISTDLTEVNTLGNALGLPAVTFTGSVSLSRPLSIDPLTDKWDGNATPIELGFGSDGTPADLAKLGFRTGAYIKGAVRDDLLVFVTGAGSASVSASYAGAPVDAKQSLRGQPMEVMFSNGDESLGEIPEDLYYTITDSNTTTEVARRKFDRNTLQPGVQYQGLQMSFTSAPLAGDVFVIDNNRDGTGNNENMLALAALEQKAMIGNKTLSGAYLDHVNDMGNIARQASIAKTALKVVNDQATVARDAIAGVNLDQEATDLIRFQQAYQAAAKVLQIAGTLFDNVLQIR